MRTILAFGVSAVALLAVSSGANAQSDCAIGWKMIKDQVPVRCDLLPSAFAGPPSSHRQPGAAVYAQTVPVEEPLYTGSIAPLNESELPPRPGGRVHSFAASRDDCQPGQYWMMALNSGNRAVACD